MRNVKGQRSRVKVKGQVADRSCTSGAPLRTSHERILSKLVRLFFKGAPWRIGRVLVAPSYGTFKK